MFIYKAGVVGAGTMGAGIAQVISFSGLPVVLKDVDEKKVERGMGTIKKIYQSRVDKGKMTATEMEQKMALVQGTTRYEDFKDCDLVVEAVFEDIKVKHEVFRELEKNTPEGAILATNTSALSISWIASAVPKRAHKVVGLHFFNPAPVMKLVEVIPGLATAPETVDDALAFVESLRKIPVRVKECEGFLVNRLLMPYLNEAVYALQDGSAGVEEIDAAARNFGMPMGPFALMDLLGLDVCADVAAILYDAYGPRMTPAALFSELKKAGFLGVKNGKGFYRYGEESGVSPEIPEMRQKAQEVQPAKKAPFQFERLLLAMINEAALCVDENVAAPKDVDIAMLAGTGFPQGKGGPLHVADAMGLEEVVRRLKEGVEVFGPRFWPSPLLKRMVAAGFSGVKSGRGFFEYGGTNG